MKMISPIYLCLLVFMLAAITGSPQNAARDSLRNALGKAAEDSNKVMLYYQYGEQFETNNTDSALYFYNKARALSQQLNFKKGLATYSGYCIVILNNQGKFKEALELCKEALGIYEKLGGKRDLCVAYINIGSEWQYLSDFELAAENYLKGQQLAEAINDKKLQRVTNNNLASVFIALQEYAKGKAYAEKSLVLAKELKDDFAVSSSTFNIATAELSLKEYDKALFHYRQVEQISKRTDDYTITLDGWQGMADAYNAMDEREKAEQYYKQVISFSKEKNAPEYEMYAYMGLADLYLKTNQLNLARQAVNNGIQLAKALDSKNTLRDLYYKQSAVEEKTGHLAAALNFRNKYELLNDTVMNEKSRSNIALFEARFEFEKKESKIKQLEDDKQLQALSIRQKNTLNYILIAGASALLIISFLTYRNYQQKQKLQLQRINELETEKKLTAAEAVLKGEEQERTRLAKDLHDGLGGMLSGIKYSFQTMKENLIMTPANQQQFERSMDMLDSSIKEMRRVAHNMMPEALVKFGLDTALKDFCNDINQSGALKVTYQSIGLDNLVIDQSATITIYRVVQELMNNIMKHASAKQSIVQVSKSDEKCSVTIEDDGIGFDPAILRSAKGIGWANIQSRLDYLKATVDIQSAPGKGTSVHIEFNI